MVLSRQDVCSPQSVTPVKPVVDCPASADWCVWCHRFLFSVAIEMSDIINFTFIYSEFKYFAGQLETWSSFRKVSSTEVNKVEHCVP